MLNHNRVELVRLRLGLTKIDFCAALEIDRKSLHHFEDGQRDLNDAAVNRLCLLSGYSKSFFSRGSFDYPNPEGVSFRSLRSLTAAVRNGALAAGALAFEIDDWVHQKFDLPVHSLPQLNNRSPEEAAIALRVNWGMGERPIDNMINVLEARGIRVFSLVEETRHLDAYSFWRNDKPYVFLNTMKTPEHGRFDAAHELGHLVMHRHTGSAHKSAEDEANAFASAFLMPLADLLAKIPVVRSLNDLISAKKRWGVSVAALNYALNKRAKVISDWNYRGFCIELNKLGRANEPNGIDPETSQIWTKVLTALWQDKITLADIAKDLAVPEIEISNLLFGIAAPIAYSSQSTGGTLHLAKS